MKEKRIWRKNLRSMVKKDEQFRIIISSNKHINVDSLWKLQSINDSINLDKFIILTDLLGYPSKERVGNQWSVLLILHFTLEKDFDKLLPLFKSELNNRNMPPWDYAIWFDRCQINMKKKSFYGEYGKSSLCKSDLESVNINRKNIGLESILIDTNCK